MAAGRVDAIPTVTSTIGFAPTKRHSLAPPRAKAIEGHLAANETTRRRNPP